MRTPIVVATLLYIAGIGEAQELKKGNVVGTHVMSVKLAPGVTMERFAEFYVEKIVPEVEKHRTGWKLYRVKRIRGEKADGFGLIIVVDSEANRDKLFNADGSPSELGKAINARLQPLVDEMQKLGTIAGDAYTDWLVY